MKKTLLFAIGLLLLLTSCGTLTPVPKPDPAPAPAPPNITPPISANVVVHSQMNAMLVNLGFPTAPNNNHWITLTFPRQPVTYTIYQRGSLQLSDAWTAVTNITSCKVDLGVPSSSTFYRASAVVQPEQAVRVAWNPSPDDSVIGYSLYYGVGFHSYDHKYDVGTNISTAVTNLDAGVTYHFAVTAYDPFAESDFSDEAVWNTPTNVAPFTISIGAWPKLPTVATFVATNVTDTSAMLQGQVVDTGRDTTATVFFYGKADPYSDTNAEWASFIPAGISTNQASVLLVGLVPNTTYYFSFAAINAAGIGQSTNSMSFTTSTSP